MAMGPPISWEEKMNSTTLLPYRLFGSLYLEDPNSFLPPERLKRLKELEPYIKCLEYRRQRVEELPYTYVATLANVS
jgi:hypothetical protein